MKLINSNDRIVKLLLGVLTSGKYGNERDFAGTDHLIQYVVQNCVCIFGSIMSMAFAVMLFNKGIYIDAIISALLALVLIACYLMGWSKMSRSVPIWIGAVCIGLDFVMLVALGNSHGANFLFMFAFPAFAIMGLGMRNGIITSITLVLIISLEMTIPGLSNYDYDFDVSIRMLTSYILVFCITSIFEVTRKAKDKLIREQTLRLQELREEERAANRMKTSFIANMSHEIRTPMNAISGMTELLMRQSLSDQAKDNVRDIKQATSQLLSLINDILDFTKIESGKLEIIPESYMLSSLTHDTVNIIRMRLIEKPVLFFTNIDGAIPKKLIGDEVRLRQIILNILSNAVKYTHVGHIGMSITVDKQTDKQVWLKIAVSDTGQGIKPEDQTKMFGEFVQVGEKTNQGIEGTGLGLAITKRLCEAMGGDITVTSEYGTGSTFTVVIPQGIGSNTPVAAVDEPERKNVLIYEPRHIYAESVCWALTNMYVPHTLVNGPDALAEALRHKEWFLVLSPYHLYNKVEPIMKNTIYPNGEKPLLALMTEWGTEVNIPNVRFVSMPVNSFSIANALNGESDRRDYIDSSLNPNAVHFTIPEARILIVDDIGANLKVAKGLLAPYNAIVDTCQSGKEALDMIMRQDYDIVFMDHIMPEMNGIEATAAIRTWEKTHMERNGHLHKPIPIVALTANAVSGMREIFIENGFSAFLAKPIDISELDSTIFRWIPKEKKLFGSKKGEKTESKNNTFPFPPIPGIDTVNGMAMTGGTEALYRDVLLLFCKDVEKRLPLLQTIHDKPSLVAFHAHALKNTAGYIGAAEAVERAVVIEAGDPALIRENLPDFVKYLADLAKKIRAALKYYEIESTESSENTPPILFSLMRQLVTVLESQKIEDLSSILKELKDLSCQYPLDSRTKNTLQQISDQVLIAEYDKAMRLVEEYMFPL